MAITRINQFQAPSDKGPALRDFLRSIISAFSTPLAVSHASFFSTTMIRPSSRSLRFGIALPRTKPRYPGSHPSLQQAQNFFAGPPQGAYYDPVPNEAA